MQATAVLMSEHRVIEQVLNVLNPKGIPLFERLAKYASLPFNPFRNWGLWQQQLAQLRYQIKQDLKSPENLARHKSAKAAEDLPALGAFYCTECAKYFSDSHNLNEHRRGKIHKRRVRMLKDEAHSQKMADAAVGLTSDRKPRVDDAAEAAANTMDIET